MNPLSNSAALGSAQTPERLAEQPSERLAEQPTQHQIQPGYRPLLGQAVVADDHASFLPTPTVRLSRLFPGAGAQIYAKLDNLQMTGSTKERTAASLLDAAFESGTLVSGGTVVESTSGNLGMALARQSALRGVRFVAVVDERANVAACQVMRAFGAEVDVVSTPADGNRLRARVERVAQLLASIDGAITTNQYGNLSNPKAHATSTLPELCDALGGAPDRLFVATSTTGTLLGCLQGVAELGLHTQVVGVDSQGSVLFGGCSAERFLPGLGAGFETELSTLAHPRVLHRVPEVQMVRGARVLAAREGILAGASTGALVAAVGVSLVHAALAPQRVGERWAFLVHDGGLPYLPNVFHDEWVGDRFGYVPAQDVELAAANPFGSCAAEAVVSSGVGVFSESDGGARGRLSSRGQQGAATLVEYPSGGDAG